MEWQNAPLLSDDEDDPEVQAALLASIRPDTASYYQYHAFRNPNRRGPDETAPWGYNELGQPYVSDPNFHSGIGMNDPIFRQVQQAPPALPSYAAPAPLQRASRPRQQQEQQHAENPNPFSVLGISARRAERRDVDLYMRNALRHRNQNDPATADHWPSAKLIKEAAEYLKDNWNEAVGNWRFAVKQDVWRPDRLVGDPSAFPFPHARTWNEAHYARSLVSKENAQYGKWTVISVHPTVPLRAPSYSLPPRGSRPVEAQNPPSASSSTQTRPALQGQARPQIQAVQSGRPYGPPVRDRSGRLALPAEWQDFWDSHNPIGQTHQLRAAIIGGDHNDPLYYQATPIEWVRQLLAHLQGFDEQQRSARWLQLLGIPLAPRWLQFLERDLSFITTGGWIEILTAIVNGETPDRAVQWHDRVIMRAMQSFQENEQTQQQQQQQQQHGQSNQPAVGDIPTVSPDDADDSDGLYGASPPHPGERWSGPHQPAAGAAIFDTRDASRQFGPYPVLPSSVGLQQELHSQPEGSQQLRSLAGGGRKDRPGKGFSGGMADDPDLWGKYDDDGPRKADETDLVYNIRIHRARINMQITRRPRPPFVSSSAESSSQWAAEEAAQRNRTNREEQEHQNKLAGDLTYRVDWDKRQASRRALNTKRRKDAFEHKNREYLRYQLRPIQHQPKPPDDSDHEDLYDRLPSGRVDVPDDGKDAFADRDREPFKCQPCFKSRMTCTYNYERFPCGPCRKKKIEHSCVSSKTDEQVAREWASYLNSSAKKGQHNSGPYLPSFYKTLPGGQTQQPQPSSRPHQAVEGSLRSRSRSPLAAPDVLPTGRSRTRQGGRLGDTSNPQQPPIVTQISGSTFSEPQVIPARGTRHAQGGDADALGSNSDPNSQEPGAAAQRAPITSRGRLQSSTAKRKRGNGSNGSHSDDQEKRYVRRGKADRGAKACDNCERAMIRCTRRRPCGPCEQQGIAHTCEASSQDQPYQIPGTAAAAARNAINDDRLPQAAPSGSSGDHTTHTETPERHSLNLPIRDEHSPARPVRHGIEMVQAPLQDPARQFPQAPDQAANIAAEAFLSRREVNQYDPPEAPGAPEAPRDRIEDSIPDEPSYLDDNNDTAMEDVDSPGAVAPSSGTPGLKPFKAVQWGHPDILQWANPPYDLDANKNCLEVAGFNFWSFVNSTAHTSYNSNGIRELLDWAENGPPRRSAARFREPFLCGTATMTSYQVSGTLTRSSQSVLPRDPVKDCDHVQDNRMCSCLKCRTDQHSRMRNFHGEDDLVIASKKWFCKNCVAEVVQKRREGPVPNLMLNQCYCISQLRDSWLCNAHRLGVKCDIQYRVMRDNARYNIDEDHWDCPGCNYEEQEEDSGAWQCRSCLTFVMMA